MTVTEYVAIGSLCLNIGIAIVGATWGIGKIRSAVQEEIAKHRATVDKKFEDLERRFQDKVDTAQNNAGEGITAIRAKVQDFEIWARDNFVRRESFLQIINEWRDGFRDLGGRIDRRLERIENVILNRPSLPPINDDYRG